MPSRPYSSKAFSSCSRTHVLEHSKPVIAFKAFAWISPFPYNIVPPALHVIGISLTFWFCFGCHHFRGTFPDHPIYIGVKHPASFLHSTHLNLRLLNFSSHLFTLFCHWTTSHVRASTINGVAVLSWVSWSVSWKSLFTNISLAFCTGLSTYKALSEFSEWINEWILHLSLELLCLSLLKEGTPAMKHGRADQWR